MDSGDGSCGSILYWVDIFVDIFGRVGGGVLIGFGMGGGEEMDSFF